MGTAMWLQYNDWLERHFWGQVYARLEGDKHVRGDIELKIRLLQRMRREDRPLSEQEAIESVARALGQDSYSPEVSATLNRVARQMVKADSLAELRDTGYGKFIAISPELLTPGEDGFSRIARTPKRIVVFEIALLWVLSPIDLILEALPVVGELDDVAVALLAARAMTEQRRKRRLGVSTPQPEHALALE